MVRIPSSLFQYKLSTRGRFGGRMIEMFKESDFYAWQDGEGVGVGKVAMLANKLLSERLSVGYCVVNDGIPWNITDVYDKHKHLTRKIHYTTEPLGPEKAKCEHHLYGTAAFETNEEGWTSTSNSMNRFCPVCGERLRDS
jgi:hypothetical protein